MLWGLPCAKAGKFIIVALKTPEEANMGMV